MKEIPRQPVLAFMTVVLGLTLGLWEFIGGFSGHGRRPWGEGWISPTARMVLGGIFIATALWVLIVEIKRSIRRELDRQDQINQNAEQ